MSPASRLLPDAKSPTIYLTHPTEEERLETWTLNSTAWGKALSQPDYLEREEYLTKAPLAKDGGVTHWILVDKELMPNRRPILASCESLRKRALVCKDGTVTEVITHGIGSVFCNPDYRGRGYASRMMKELGENLRTWQTDAKKVKCAFSVLWSDIGKTYYADHGWHPFPSTHIEFPQITYTENEYSTSAKTLDVKDIEELCERDESLIRQTLIRSQDNKTHVCLTPDFESMQWHHVREDFMCEKIFGKQPKIRGAIIGEPGHRIWAIWTRSYYGPLVDASGNTLHILRLVIEDEVPQNSFSGKTGGPMYDGRLLDNQAKQLKEIMQIAQAEAAKWQLLHVELWNPTPTVLALIDRSGLKHSSVEREKESIPSLMWYGAGSGKVDEVEWVGNEKFGWC